MGRGVEVVPMVLQNRWRMQRWGGCHKAAGQQRRPSCPGGSDCMAEVSDHSNLCCSVTANLRAHSAHPMSSLHTDLEASWYIYRKKAEATPLQSINAKKCHPLAPSSILLYSLLYKLLHVTRLLSTIVKPTWNPAFSCKIIFVVRVTYFILPCIISPMPGRPWSAVNVSVNATTSANVSYEKYTAVRYISSKRWFGINSWHKEFSRSNYLVGKNPYLNLTCV